MTNRSSDVLVTGIGVLSPIGLSIAELERSLLNNRSGIGLWQSEALSKPVPAGQIGTDFSDRFSKLELPYLDRCSQIAMLAADQAIDDAGLAGFAECGQRAGLFYGSVAGGVKTEHAALPTHVLAVKDDAIRREHMHYLSLVSDLLGLIGQISSYYTQENTALVFNSLSDVIHERSNALKLNIQLKLLQSAIRE